MVSNVRELEVPAGQYPGPALKGVVGRALAGNGMTVRVQVSYQDDISYEIYAEIVVTNPAKAGHGKVRVADYASIQWECSLAGPGGLRPGDIAQTIASALAGHST